MSYFFHQKQIQEKHCNSKQISPTFISNDVMSPSQNDRKTIPYHGQQTFSNDLSEQTKWGEGICNYSGIGINPFHKKIIERDLPIGRTHRHYDSGVIQKDFRWQPQRLTDLKKAHCRLNDQILPKSTDTSFNPHIANPYLLDEDKDPWFTHKPIHDVFPLPDPTRRDEYGHFILSDDTRKTLNNYYHHLHHTPLHRDNYPNHYDHLRYICDGMGHLSPPPYSQPQAQHPQYCSCPYNMPVSCPANQQQTINFNNPYQKYDGPQSMGCTSNTISKIGSSKSDSALETFKWDRNSGYQMGQLTYNSTAETIKYGYSGRQNGQKQMSKVNNNCNPGLQVSLNQDMIVKLIDLLGSDAVSQLMRSPEYPDNCLKILKEYDNCVPRYSTHKTVQETQMLWPPGPTYTINTSTAQIQERGQLHQNQWSDQEKCQTRDLGSVDNINHLKRPFQCTVNVRKSGLPSRSYYDQTFQTNIDTYNRFFQPKYEPSNITSNVAPLNSYLHPTGNRVVDNIGLPFKSMAQRRFHAMHPEHIPDLRENHRTSKKFNFMGTNGAAAQRGQCIGIPVDSGFTHIQQHQLGYHGQCSAPLTSFCPMQRSPLASPKQQHYQRENKVYRWNECFIEK